MLRMQLGKEGGLFAPPSVDASMKLLPVAVAAVDDASVVMAAVG